MPRLLIQNGDGNPQKHELEGERFTVGRHQDNTVVIEDGSVSGHHAEIATSEGIFTLRDLESSNGTRVNGQRISQATIKDGDIIRFGKLECRFEDEDEFSAGIPEPELPVVTEIQEFCKSLKNANGEVIGLWVADPNDPMLNTFVEEFQASNAMPIELFAAFEEGRYRIVPNRIDKSGGAFLRVSDPASAGKLEVDLSD